MELQRRSRHARARLHRRLCLSTLAVAGCLAAPVAHAQVLERFALRGEAGAGTMFPQHQREMLGYDSVNFQGTGRLAFSLFDPLALQVSAGNWWFLTDGQRETGRLTTYTGGLRLEPRIGRVGRLFLDANAGVGFTGGLTRVAFDMGVGFEFALARFLHVGPVLRYGHVFQDPNDQFPKDAVFWSGGLSVTLRVPATEAPRPVEPTSSSPPTDSDGDGVFDGDDLCIHVPAGPHPDPARPGCPLNDADNDGVFDNEDQCPTTPRGPHPDPDRPGCPDSDDDNDGVLNHADQCRTVHHGAHPDRARPGCPLPDRDRDSVPDAMDHCPDEPGAPHPDPIRNGCPGLVRVEGSQIRILQQLFFATNRDRILPRSYPLLQAVAHALEASPMIVRVAIEGHTDDVGDDARNLDLSQRRANSVMQWLISHGIDASRLEAHGYGETRPMLPVTASTPRRERSAARAQNRRVDFRIVETTMTPAAATTP
jgi:outer membrane protein OmpA-like peptidoglycan-associated protein